MFHYPCVIVQVDAVLFVPILMINTQLSMFNIQAMLANCLVTANYKFLIPNYNSFLNLATGMFNCSRYLATVRRAIL